MAANAPKLKWCAIMDAENYLFVDKFANTLKMNAKKAIYIVIFAKLKKVTKIIKATAALKV